MRTLLSIHFHVINVSYLLNLINYYTISLNLNLRVNYYNIPIAVSDFLEGSISTRENTGIVQHQACKWKKYFTKSSKLELITSESLFINHSSVFMKFLTRYLLGISVCTILLDITSRQPCNILLLIDQIAVQLNCSVLPFTYYLFLYFGDHSPIHLFKFQLSNTVEGHKLTIYDQSLFLTELKAALLDGTISDKSQDSVPNRFKKNFLPAFFIEHSAATFKLNCFCSHLSEITRDCQTNICNFLVFSTQEETTFNQWILHIVKFFTIICEDSHIVFNTVIFVG